jgi:hypothetical protein
MGGSPNIRGKGVPTMEEAFEAGKKMGRTVQEEKG